jgi:predicted nucleotidyltransferase
MNAARQPVSFVEEEKHILRTLLYFDIFNYPINEKEIIRFSRSPFDFSISQILENLSAQRIIFKFQNFYSLHDEPKLVLRRLKGNELAEKKIKTANRFSRLIASFPFVRAVMLSGSISKGYMDEESDIDYFIITEANRLWFVRTALALFRRIFLFNSHRNLCTNYFIDCENLEIVEKNIFTAIELCTLKSMFGKSEIKKFQSCNEWTLSYLPNAQLENVEIKAESFLLKRAIEGILSLKIIDLFNEWLMHKTILYWNKKYRSHLDSGDFEIAFRSTTGISKSHPQFFQKKVLSRFDQKVHEFEMQHRIELAL